MSMYSNRIEDEKWLPNRNIKLIFEDVNQFSSGVMNSKLISEVLLLWEIKFVIRVDLS